MHARFEIKGLPEMLKTLKKLPAEFQKRAEAGALRAGAREIAKEVTNRVAVDSGNLRRSIGVSVRSGRGKFGKGVARIGPRSGFLHPNPKNVTGRKRGKGKRIDAPEYAWYLEKGTPKQAARPFIRPALDASRSDVRQAMANGLEKYLERLVRRLAKKRLASK